MDETKPDQLAKKQVEGWICEWQNDDQAANTTSQQDSDKKHILHGSLKLHGSYITAILRAHSHWVWHCHGGCLEFELGIRCELKNDLSETGSSHSPPERHGISMRLRQDDYIQKVLKEDFTTICQAMVLLKETSSELEERVWTDQELLESIRRAIYSQADSLLSVMELLTSLPYLETPGCPLGLRARLRLLEDAMIDACEQEGEEELIEELTLDESTTKGECHDDEDDKAWEKVLKKKQKR